MNLSSTETAMEFGSYPERPGEPDCSYYIRTGLCRFGETCRYNHPPNRTLAFANAWMKGEYPERFGQPECQYYLKTGTCKFGVTCKFHHPRDKAGIAGRVALNTYGYPLRPNEAECTYYLRTGLCKFGTTCKFHHPQPNNMMLSLRGSPVYTSLHSATASGQQSYPGGITNWSRMSLVASPRWQNPSTYTPMILPQGMVSVPGYAYSGQLGSDSSPNSQRQTVGNSQIQVDVHQSNYLNGASQEIYTSYQDGSVPQDFYALPTENLFPERPGEPECLYYMKTGDCKFGSVCKFHHPRERVIPVPDCLLSPMGLPLRPGEPPCAFYSRYGICKFGPNCKFDHPMEILTNETAASSSANAPSRHIGLSARAAVLTSPSEGFDEASTNPRQFPLSDSRDIHSDGDNNE